MTVTFDRQTCAALARELHEAERRREQVRHLSGRYPDMSIEDGYAVSREWVRIKQAEGQRIVGHKIGLTSRAMQVSSQIDEPDYGTLLDEMVYESNSVIPARRFIKPRVEVELAFLLRAPLAGPDVSVNDVLNATDRVTPALEIIDARIEQFDRETGAPRKVFDTISDNAANAGIVLGGSPVRPDEVDLPRVGALIYLNGIVEESGLAGAVLGHPANGVAWLARRLHRYGERLEAGQIVLAGSFTRPIPMTAGDVIHADYGRLGAISFRLA
ncbi:MAG TPA: 2-oxo-hepta-3-ene-1,7-dioic acid hydratase [Nocardia sp.]|uniref:2-oxo-hept-4-ene-1,7-dioate hydratase n=1 Tax=Nocardia TaxID=1817 RepID=UPI00245882ED|nr:MULTISPECIES: 2-oxo-hepta-3-ene-1,7-dioic acid hydratase [Nocardia]HLS76313.1 2-oxo-hepta-3-ene-1,7-dioic acid hydratase [Nocardia sp.]